MMRRLSGGQAKFFYEFSLEERVSDGHLLRRIDRVLDLDDLHHMLACLIIHSGRPRLTRNS
jgi:hypothetical protein